MFFRKIDKEKRRKLRLNMTKAEKYLWEELRKKQRSGFRRQFSVDGYHEDNSLQPTKKMNEFTEKDDLFL
jgi:very-short-patch-repair endonuclease